MRTLIHFLCVCLLFTSCCLCKKKAQTRAKCHYYTYEEIARYHKTLFEDMVRKKGIDLYQQNLKTNKLGASEIQIDPEDMERLEEEFSRRFFEDDVVINKKSGSRNAHQRKYRVKRALEVLSDQVNSYSSLTPEEKTELTDYVLSKKSIWIREIDLPYSDYDHVSSPYKNKSLVFYHFDVFNPATGFGIYYQTNAFYLRDAYDLSYDELSRHDRRIEYFCAPFFVQKTSSGILLNLLSPANELIERKVFEVTKFKHRSNSIDSTAMVTPYKNTGSAALDLNFELFKKYEYKLGNDFPFNLGSYKLKWYPEYDTYREEEKTKLKNIYNVASPQNIKNGQVNEFNELDPDALASMDFMYPVKVPRSDDASCSGWVYFGKVYLDKKYYDTTKIYDSSAARAFRELRAQLDTGISKQAIDLSHPSLIQLKDETFYRKSKLIWYEYNNEIENIWQLLRKNTRIQPLEIVYLRSSPDKQVDNIIGEVRPYKIYEVDSLKLNGDYLWVKLRSVKHEPFCTECEPSGKLFKGHVNNKRYRKNHKNCHCHCPEDVKNAP